MTELEKIYGDLGIHKELGITDETLIQRIESMPNELYNRWIDLARECNVLEDTPELANWWFLEVMPKIVLHYDTTIALQLIGSIAVLTPTHQLIDVVEEPATDAQKALTEGGEEDGD